MAEKTADKKKTRKKSSRTSYKGMPSSIKHNLSEDTTDADIKRIVGESIRFFKLPCAETDEECAERLDAYFADCYQRQVFPTVEDMCLCLGTDRGTVSTWANGKRGENRASIIKKARQILAAIDARLASEGKIPQVVYIFRSKNFHGMKDQQDVLLAPANPLGDAQSAEALRKKYAEETYGLGENVQQKAISSPRTANLDAEGAERELDAVIVDENMEDTGN